MSWHHLLGVESPDSEGAVRQAAADGERLRRAPLRTRHHQLTYPQLVATAAALGVHDVVSTVAVVGRLIRTSKVFTVSSKN